MNREDLQKHSKDELINIILELQDKGCIQSSEIAKYISYRDLLESTSDIIFVIDKNERIVYINNAWHTIFPARSHDIIGEHYAIYITLKEKNLAREVFASVIEKGVAVENEILKTSDDNGNDLYLSTSFSPIKTENGEIVGIIGIMKNITQEYLAQKKLKQNSKILEAKVKEQVGQADELKKVRDLNDDIIRNAPIGIFMMDPSGIMLTENQALVKIMGRKPEESVVGVNLIEYSGFIESGFSKLFEQALREKKTVHVNNTPYKPIVGRGELIINVIMSPVFNKNGSVESVIIMVEDITEQAKTAKRMIRAEKLSELATLASGVASELKSYSNKMVMNLNFVGNNIDRNNPAAEYIDSLQEDLEGIKNISEQLLSLSAVDEGVKEVCELNKLVASHPVEVFLKRIRNEGFDVEVITSPEEPRVNATQNQLQQIVLEFLENAGHAMPDKGKITVSVGTTEEKEGKYALLTVTDTGIGIPDENFQKIFQPFFTTKGKEATGLGLMIVSSLVENLGGCIGVKSKPGEGTSIRIALPMVK